MNSTYVNNCLEIILSNIQLDCKKIDFNYLAKYLVILQPYFLSYLNHTLSFTVIHLNQFALEQVCNI